jgi:hypothetical protein
MSNTKSDTKSRAAPKFETKRLTIQISGSDLENLEWLAEEQKIPLTEAIRKALSTDAFIKKTLKKGADVLIKENSEDIYKLLLQ